MNDQTKKLKLEFFNKLLEANPQIKAQYDEYAASVFSLESMSGKTEAYINEVAREIQDELEEIDFTDFDWEFYTPRHSGYIPEYEAMGHMAEDKVEEFFSGLEDTFETDLVQGKTARALLFLVAVYDACIEAEINDEYCTLPDDNEYLLNQLQELQEKIIQSLSKQVIPGNSYRDFLEGLCTHYRQHYETDDQYLRFFEPLLLSLTANKEMAAITGEVIQAFRIPNQQLPRLLTKIHSLTGNIETWVHTSEQVLEHDSEVALKLLEHYHKTDYNRLVSTGEKLWNNNRFKKETAQLLYKTIDPEASPDFYKRVISFLTGQNRTVKYYKELREFLTEKEKEDFINKHYNDNKFYSMMLHVENRHEELLHYIRKNKDSWNFNNIVQYILEPFPGESFSLLKEKILKKIENERGRYVYQEVASWLNIALKIKSKNANARELILKLYHHKPNLPALKDEFRQAGLV